MDVATTIFTLDKTDVMLWLQTRATPAVSEWDVHIAKLRAASARRGGDMRGFVSLVVSDGGHPSARERKIIFSEIFGEVRSPFAAVCVDLANPVLRSVATVIAWLQPGFRAFPPGEMANALDHVGLAAHGERVIVEFEGLQKGLGPVRTLELAKAALKPQAG
jgi:hypothetical protein